MAPWAILHLSDRGLGCGYSRLLDLNRYLGVGCRDDQLTAAHCDGLVHWLGHSFGTHGHANIALESHDIPTAIARSQ